MEDEAGPEGDAPVLCLVGKASVTLWGMTTGNRLIRQFRREGIHRTVTPEQAAAHSGPVYLVRADAVIDQPLLARLMGGPDDSGLLGQNSGGHQPVAIKVSADLVPRAVAILTGKAFPAEVEALAFKRPDELDAAFWSSLRKREVPYAMIVTEENRSAAEWRMFMGTYKGATDLVTKHVWPRPAFFVTRWLAPSGVTPNMITALSAVFVVVTFVLFWNGYFLAGLASAWLMTFLDTVDGKLARVTLTSTRWGDIFDHGIDLIHPPFWYAAWAVGLSSVGLALPSDVLAWALGIIIGGYVLQRVMEGIAIKYLGMEIHIWRPIDTVFRQITARRNPNLLILSVFFIAGLPDTGLIAVAVWTGLCLTLHAVQVAQALAAKRRKGSLSSWMSETATVK